MNTLDEFKSQLNTIFSTKTETDTIDLELVEAHSFKQNHENTKSFALLFRYNGGNPLQQNTYELVHEKLGKLDVFLVPQPPNEKYNFVEALFNI